LKNQTIFGRPLYDIISYKLYGTDFDCVQDGKKIFSSKLKPELICTIRARLF